MGRDAVLAGGPRKPTPERSPGTNHAGYYGSRISPVTEKRESGQIPRGAPSWRGASADASGLGDPSRPSNRAVRRNPDNAPSRRATPLISGGGQGDGPPRARPKGGASMALAIHALRKEDESIEQRPRRSSPSPGGGGSTARAKRGGRGGVTIVSDASRSPHPARFARDPPPPGEGGTECLVRDWVARFREDDN